MKFLYIFLIILVISLFSVYSAPPFLEQESSTGLTILYPKAIYQKANQDFQFHIHLFDENNLILNSSVAGCRLHFYNQTGHHIIDTTLTYIDKDFSYNINGYLIPTSGTYAWNVWCYYLTGTEKGGFVSAEFFITETGKEESQNNYVYFTIAFIYFVIIGLLFFFSSQVDFKYISKKGEEKTLSAFKYLVWLICGWLIYASTFISIKINEVMLLGLTNLVLTISKATMYIMYIFTFIFIFYIIFKALAYLGGMFAND